MFTSMPGGRVGRRNNGILAAIDFDGVSVGMRSSFNVRTVTAIATGVYRVFFANSLPDANYSVLASGRWDDLNGNNDTPMVGPHRFNPYTQNQCDIAVVDRGGGVFNCRYVWAVFFDAGLIRGF